VQRDLLEFVIDTLASCLPGVCVAEQLPPLDRLDAELPVLRVDELPGSATVTAWGGTPVPLLDSSAFELEVFAPSLAVAKPVAERAAEVMFTLSTVADSPVTQVKCPSSFAARPDFNPRVRVLGAEFTLDAHTM